MFYFIHSKFDNIFIFQFLRVLSYSLISWVHPLSGDFMASYHLVDSLGGEVFFLDLLSLGWILLSGEFEVSYPLVDSLGGEEFSFDSLIS